MKSYRIKKHRMMNVKINVIVQPDEINMIIPPGGKFDAIPLPALPKPLFQHKLITKINKPTYVGRLELTFDGMV